MGFVCSLWGVLAGIICAYEMLPGKFIIILISILLLLFTAISLLSRRIYSPLIVIALFLSLGYVSGINAFNIDNSNCKEYIGKDVEIYGKIVDLPQNNVSNYSYNLYVHLIKDEAGMHKIYENVRLTTKEQLNYGDVVCVLGKIKPIPTNSNEFGFNSKIYYKSRGLSYKVYSETITKYDIRFPIRDIRSLVIAARSEMYKTINTHYFGDDAALLCAIAVGTKSGFSKDFNELLNRTGVRRCLYPAFVQIMLFMFFLSLIQTKVPQKIRFIMLALFLLIFGVGNSSNPVFLKSALYIAIFYTAKQFLGYALKQDIIFMVITAMLIANPSLIFDGGFVSSSVSNILIIYFMPFIRSKLKFIKINYIKNTIAISIICTIGLIPLSAYYFNGVAIYQILATLLLIPMTAIMFILSPLLVLLFKIFGRAPIISSIINFLLYLYKGVPYFIDKLPKEYITLGIPNILTIIAFYLLIYALYKHLDKRSFYFPLIVSCLLFGIVTAQEYKRTKTAEVTFINVGQGDAALVSIPHKTNIIVDGGGGYDFQTNEDQKSQTEEEYNIGEEIFVPYLQTHGVTNIDAAFVSHYHKDHVEGIVAAIEMLDVDKVYMPDLLPENEWRKKIEKAAKSHGTEITYINKDTRISLDSFSIKIYYPTNTALKTEDENNTSLLYKINYGKTSTLFTGDMTSLYEASMIYSNKNVDCDILKVAHHGSAYSTCKEFVKATSPQYAVISLGQNNPYNFPRKEVLDNLRDIDIYRTDINGDIRFTIDKDGIQSIYTLN